MNSYFRDHLFLLKFLFRWFLLIIPVAVVSGSASALFLWSLSRVTELRLQNPWLIFLLPLGGVLIVWVYNTWGGRSSQGNNLLIDEIHTPGGGIPGRMAPMILVTTLLTHLFGGSAGREGTAVQMGGSIASVWGRRIKLGHKEMPILLMAGIAAGFGSVFGTPLAGTIFALEVLVIGQIQFTALIPCLMSALLADEVCKAWGVGHTHYNLRFEEVLPDIISTEHLIRLGLVALTGAFAGLAALLFSESTHAVSKVYKKWFSWPYWPPIIGGIVIIMLAQIPGATDYLGLGVEGSRPGGVSILSSFENGGALPLSWLWKLIFTIITLGSGFRGGEVTPLFFIGAALGNTISAITGAPADLMAAIGFIAVFAGAANTPLACTIMGIELFGAADGTSVLYYAIACFTAYLFSGKAGIYKTQKKASEKIL